MLNSQSRCGFLVPAPMLSMEKMTQVTKSFVVTGFDIACACYVCASITVYCLSIVKLLFSSRQNGRSYVGVLDHDSGSFSTIDIPFSAVTNIVRTKSDLLPDEFVGRHAICYYIMLQY